MPQALRHEFLLTPLREGRPASIPAHIPAVIVFLLTPLREGRQYFSSHYFIFLLFLLTPLREGQLPHDGIVSRASFISTHAPAGGATRSAGWRLCPAPISTHAPAGGATSGRKIGSLHAIFLLTPLREGRRDLRPVFFRRAKHFYSRPCGRGDVVSWSMRGISHRISTHAPAGGATNGAQPLQQSAPLFLLTPLREGRLWKLDRFSRDRYISTHAPAGGATDDCYNRAGIVRQFLLTPLREGRLCQVSAASWLASFLLTPLREGRRWDVSRIAKPVEFLLTPLREGRPVVGAVQKKRGKFLLTPLREGRP